MHLAKPVEPHELVKVVARLAGRDLAVTALEVAEDAEPAFGP
jgi:hypothetical protein